MRPEKRFHYFVQERMYVDLKRLREHCSNPIRKRDGEYTLILRTIPLRLRTSSGRISSKLQKFVGYKLDLLERYRAGEPIDPVMINAGFRTPIVRNNWLQRTSLDVTVAREHRVATLEDRFSKMSL